MRTPPTSVCVALAMLASLQCGCGSFTDNDRLDDEAMKMARSQGKDPATAAREWFYPKEIHDYFPGMDQIVVRGDGKGSVNPLDVPVYQLLDLTKGVLPTVSKVNSISLAKPVHVYDKKLCSDYEKDSPGVCEVFGRNAWMLWAGGNEGFWDWLSREYGFIDLLKLVDSHERSTRFATGGLINEPGMKEASAPDEFGLWLDVPSDPKVKEWRQGYIRRAFGLGRATGGGGSGGVYGTQPTQVTMAGYSANDLYDPNIPPPEIYGLSTGVIGLRLFPNPNFDAAAQKRWKDTCGDNAARAGCEAYYGDAKGDPRLIRPYRVGMSCAFCHASYHPLNPPADLVNPEWTNISGNIGAQYLRPRAAFGNLLPKDNLVYHILDSQPPGTIDTSLIASDNINNPNAMNAVFNLPQRALASMRNPKETLVGASAQLPSIWRSPGSDTSAGDVVPDFWRNVFESLGLADELSHSNEAARRVPHILFDGADSIGAYGALARVYLNIGTNYEQWNTLHNPVVGFAPQKPFTLVGARQHSVYWYATQLRVAPLRDYFLKVSPPMPLQQAGAEADRPPIDDELLKMLPIGRKVFAHNCIVCHSSIQFPARYEEMKKYADIGEFWEHNPGRWLSDPEYLKWAEAAVEDPEFWRKNYLSTDYRIPVNLVNTNACRGLATNAMAGNMWEDYSSQSYKQMPSPGAMTFFNPYLGEHGADSTFTTRHATPAGAPPGGGGPGFYRVPTLVSIWATAPYLHNNSLGLFNNKPSVSGRLAAFNDGIEKLLWPERRLASSSYNGATAERLKADHGLIWRTDQATYVTIGGLYVTEILGSRIPFLRNLTTRYPGFSRLPKFVLPFPTAVLLLAAFFVLRRAPNLPIRLIGYTLILAALSAGGLLYFLNGQVGGVRVGPIPKGTPVSLLANANPTADPAAVKNALTTTVSTLIELSASHASSSDFDQAMRTRVAPALMAISKCPDFVMDRGHYFKWFDQMTDQDKRALIALLKTF